MATKRITKKRTTKKTTQTKKLSWIKKTLGRFGFKHVAIVCVLIGIGCFMRQSTASKNELKMHQALQIFLRVDDYAHEGIAGQRPRWTESIGAIARFEIVDTKFHDAKTLKERFQRAKEMDKILDEIDENIHATADTSQIQDFEYRDRKFDEINNIFDQLSE